MEQQGFDEVADQNHINTRSLYELSCYFTLGVTRKRGRNYTRTHKVLLRLEGGGGAVAFLLLEQNPSTTFVLFFNTIVTISLKQKGSGGEAYMKISESSPKNS